MNATYFCIKNILLKTRRRRPHYKPRLWQGKDCSGQHYYNVLLHHPWLLTKCHEFRCLLNVVNVMSVKNHINDDKCL